MRLIACDRRCRTEANYCVRNKNVKNRKSNDKNDAWGGNDGQDTAIANAIEGLFEW